MDSVCIGEQRLRDLVYVSSASLTAEIDFLMVRLSSLGILLVRHVRCFFVLSVNDNTDRYDCHLLTQSLFCMVDFFFGLPYEVTSKRLAHAGPMFMCAVIRQWLEESSHIGILLKMLFHTG